VSLYAYLTIFNFNFGIITVFVLNCINLINLIIRITVIYEEDGHKFEISLENDDKELVKQ